MIIFNKVTQENKGKYKYLFKNIKYFKNFIEFALNTDKYEIYLDNEVNPINAILVFEPLFTITGNIDDFRKSNFIELLGEKSFIIPKDKSWDIYLNHEIANITRYNRYLFKSDTLDINKLKSMKKQLPSNMSIIPINQNHVDDTSNTINWDLLRKYFYDGKFLENGFGYALEDNGVMVGYSASNFPLVKNELEVMFRVNFNDEPTHRFKGYGTQLAINLLIECLEKGITPTWDAAVDISAHIALKLGYTLDEKWYMYLYEKDN